MNIVFITQYTELYGANRSLINLIKGLRVYKNINPLVIIPNKGMLCNVLIENNIDYLIQNFHNWSHAKNESITKSSYKQVLKKYIKEYLKKKKRKSKNRMYVNEIAEKLNIFKPDIVYSNSSVFNFGILLSKKIKKPHIWHLREFGLEDYDMHFEDSLKRVSSCLNQSDGIITISKAINNYYFKKFSLKKSNIIYNGVLNINQLKNIDNRKLNYLNNQTGFVFGIIGLIQKSKGQLEAIKALSIVCKKHPNSILLIAGTGNSAPLHKLAKELNLINNIKFLGFVEDPFDFFLQIDTLLMCSKNEGLGRVTLEAMATGIPVIGYKNGGTIEIIEEKKTGLFYETDHIDLSEQMNYLIENKKVKLEMGQSARKRFEEKYTQEIYAEKIYSVLKKTINKH